MPLSIVPLFYGEPLLLFLGQDAAVVKNAQKYMIYMMPGVLIYGVYDCLKRFLNAMHITFVPALAQIIAVILYLPGSYWLVFKCKTLGHMEALGLAYTLNSVCLLIFTFVYSLFLKQIEGSLQMVDMTVFKNWGDYLKISVPSTVMLCAEWWAYELLMVFAGNISVESLVAQIMCMTCIATLFMFAIGLQEATCACLGEAIGAGNVPAANKFFWISFKCAAVTMLIIQVVFITNLKEITELFSSDPAVQELAQKGLLVNGVFFFTDGM